MFALAGPALSFKAAAGSEQVELTEIGFAKTATDVIYRGTNLFGSTRAAVVSILCSEDPEPRAISGTLVFPKLGITLTGFHSGPEESVAVTAFAPGIWDAKLIGAELFKVG
jgi:hypothetical protein